MIKAPVYLLFCLLCIKVHIIHAHETDNFQFYQEDLYFSPIVNALNISDINESALSGGGSIHTRAHELLLEAQSLYNDLLYDKVPPLTEKILSLDDVDISIRLEAYRLQAQSLAIISDPVEAEGPFRLLLRARPDFDLPDDTPPRILAVFRKVQAEERIILEQVEAFRRNKIIEQISLSGDFPERARGGLPISFSFRLRDPAGSVQSIDLPYRKEDQTSWSVLALDRLEDGSWRGNITGEWTVNLHGFNLEYYIRTMDEEGPLLVLGREEPFRIAVAPGALEKDLFKPIPKWAWITGAVSSGILTVLGGGLALAGAHAQSDYADYASRGLLEPVDGSVLKQKEARGRLLVNGANAAFISAASTAVITLAVTPLVNRD